MSNSEWAREEKERKGSFPLAFREMKGNSVLRNYEGYSVTSPIALSALRSSLRKTHMPLCALAFLQAIRACHLACVGVSRCCGVFHKTLPLEPSAKKKKELPETSPFILGSNPSNLLSNKKGKFRYKLQSGNGNSRATINP